MLSHIRPDRTRVLMVVDTQIHDPKEGLAQVKNEVLTYLRDKIQNLPSDIFVRENYDHEDGLFSSDLISTGQLEVWSCRFNEPDASVPGRSWILEISLAQQASNALIGGRLSCYSRTGQFEYQPATPRLFKRLIQNRLLKGDGIRLSDDPHEIRNDGDLEWLLALLNNPRRWRLVVAVACDEWGRCVINPNFLAGRLAGLAHVVKIFPAQTFALSDLVSRQLSVFDGGIRIYRPTPDLAKDDPFTHRLITRRMIESEGAGHEDVVLLEAAKQSVSRVANKADLLPTFAAIRVAAAKFRLGQTEKAGANLDDQLAAALVARQAAESQAEEALNLAAQEEQLRQEAEQERNYERAYALALAARVRELENKLAEPATAKTALPTSYRDVASWVEENFTGRLRLHPRAHRSLKDAVYEDISLVCGLIELLATHYVDAKRGVQHAYEKFVEEVGNKGVDLSKSISSSRAGEQGDEYYVTIANRRTFIEWHLKKGTSRMKEKDLRIYFLWDEELEEVVVASLPAHLDNRLT